MSFTLEAYADEYTTYDGIEYPECIKEWEPELKFCEHCFVIAKSIFGRYYIVEKEIVGYWFTNIWGWTLSNGWHINATDYGTKIFKPENLSKAIAICEEKNRMRKVKVKRL